MEALRSAEALQIHWEAAHSGKETQPKKQPASSKYVHNGQGFMRGFFLKGGKRLGVAL